MGKIKSQTTTPATPTDPNAPPKVKKTRTPGPSWGSEDKNLPETEREAWKRDRVLAQVLKGDEALIKTASSVTAALLKHPEFAGMEGVLTPLMVATRVKKARDKFEKANEVLVAKGKAPQPIPDWLKLDSARAGGVNLSAFTDDEDDD